MQLLHAVTSVAEYPSSSIVTTASAAASVAAAAAAATSGMTEMAALLAQAVNVKNEPEDLTGGGVATVNNNRRPSASDHDIHSR